MAVVFLIGGTGNQLYQIANSHEGDIYSDLLLKRVFCRMVGWTYHERFLELTVINTLAAILIFPLMFIDLFLGVVFKFSLFSDFDIRRLRLDSKFKPIFKLGYFQSAPDDIGIKRVMALVDLSCVCNATYTRYDCVVHVRGGDLANSKYDIGGYMGGSYGILDSSYYRECILAIQKMGFKRILVFSNDDSLCKLIFSEINIAVETNTKHSLIEFFSAALYSPTYVASNSTLSFWVCILRSPNLLTYAPDPFLKNSDMRLGTHVVRVNSRWRRRM